MADEALDPWTTRQVLILGSTYPSHSVKYREVACTGAIECESYRMVRLHPIPMRYLNARQRFQKFQLVTVRTRPQQGDGRPETLRVEIDSIRPGQVIPSTNAEERRKYLDSSPHLIGSVEQLRERWKKDRTSLGIVRPRLISDCTIEKRSKRDAEEWEEKEKARMAEQVAFGDPPMPLDFVPVAFKVAWTCDDAACEGHDMRIQQWGLHELYRKLAADPDREEKVLAKMRSELDMTKHDVYLFLGNFRGTEVNFGLMDSYSPPKRVLGQATQRTLF